MDTYAYRSLDEAADEIRLVELLPGYAGDALSLHIGHIPFRHYTSGSSEESCGPSLEHLQKTLKEGWTAHKTFADRYLFFYTGEGSKPNSWKHPDPTFDNTLLDTESRPEAADIPRYEALSYTWGDQGKPICAYIRDKSMLSDGLRQIRIGENLASALIHLRYTDKPRTLWIDAICINQNDIIERNAQVKRMGSIYAGVTRVIAWIGDATSDNDLAISTLRYFAQQVEVTSSYRFGDSPDAEEPRWWEMGFELPYDEATWSALVACFQRPWFHRLWILQEVQLGSKDSILQCGNSTIDFTSIRKAIFVLDHKVNIPKALSKETGHLNAGVLNLVGVRMETIFLSTTHRKCTDPKDRVYGILSLASSAISSRIQPDYASSTQQIYKDAMLAAIHGTNSLGLLQFCQIGSRYGESWVPNWNAVPTCSLARSLVANSKSAGMSVPQVRYKAPNTLEVCGVRCAVVSSVGKAASGTLNEILTTIRSWEPDGLDERGYVTGGALIDAFLEVLVLGHVRDRIKRRTLLPSLAELRSAYLTARSHDPLGSEVFDGYPDKFRFDDVSMIYTFEGYLGLAPSDIKEGDRIAVLLGCNFPVVIRPADDENYMVIGRCYVHGLMNAEAFLGPIPAPWQPRSEGLASSFSSHFVNTETGEQSDDDPRMEPLPIAWKQIEALAPGDVRLQLEEYRYALQGFKNAETGEVLPCDPRMTPDDLRKRGVELEMLKLV